MAAPIFRSVYDRRCALPSFFIAGLWLLLVVVEAIRPHFFLHDDNATWFIGSFVHDFRVLTKTGRLAEVNYYQYGGEPFLQQGQTAVLYPPVYLGVALAKWVSHDLRWAIEWIAAEHLTLGLLGFYFWLRQAGVTPGLAALGGLAWVLNPFILIVASSWIMVTFIAAWLPWLIWAFDRLWARPSFLSALLLGIIAASLFLQGYVQWFAYSILFLGLYALFRFAERRTERRRSLVYLLDGIGVDFPDPGRAVAAADASCRGSFRREVTALSDYPGARLSGIEKRSCPRPAGPVSTQPDFWNFHGDPLFPALFLLPLMVLRFFYAGTEIRRRLFPLLILSFLALFFPAAGMSC